MINPKELISGGYIIGLLIVGPSPPQEFDALVPTAEVVEVTCGS
jgi:hypothetical protein